MIKSQHIKHFILIALLFGVTFSFAMFQGGFVSWFIFLVILPFLLYSLLIAVIPISIQEVQRELSAYRVERGRNIEVTVKFKIKTPLPLLFVTAKETLPKRHSFRVKNGQLGQLFFAGLKREFEWRYTLQELTRGEHELYAIEVIASDFFGWVTRTTRHELPKTIVVYPQLTDIANTSLTVQYDQGGVVAKYRSVKDTALVSGLRDYQPGDRFSQVHWKSFAKTGNLRTKEFEDRQSQNITLCLDRSTREHFESAVDLTASIVKSAVRNHNDIAFISGGDPKLYYSTIQTDLQLEQVLHHLAVVQPSGAPIQDSFKGKERQLSKSILIIVAGDLSKGLLNVLQKDVPFANQVICYLTAPNIRIDNIKLAPHCKVLAVDHDQFAKVFSEVNKR
jgi:uncharacterized protein (DUF58 family)